MEAAHNSHCRACSLIGVMAFIYSICPKCHLCVCLCVCGCVYTVRISESDSNVKDGGVNRCAAWFKVVLCHN